MVVPAAYNPTTTTSTISMPDNGDVVEIIQWLGNVMTRKLDEVEQVIQSSQPRVTKSYQGPSMTDIAFRY